MKKSKLIKELEYIKKASKNSDFIFLLNLVLDVIKFSKDENFTRDESILIFNQAMEILMNSKRRG